jgi:hypothetical protein
MERAHDFAPHDEADLKTDRVYYGSDDQLEGVARRREGLPEDHVVDGITVRAGSSQGRTRERVEGRDERVCSAGLDPGQSFGDGQAGCAASRCGMGATGRAVRAHRMMGGKTTRKTSFHQSVLSSTCSRHQHEKHVSACECMRGGEHASHASITA